MKFTNEQSTFCVETFEDGSVDLTLPGGTVVAGGDGENFTKANLNHDHDKNQTLLHKEGQLDLQKTTSSYHPQSGEQSQLTVQTGLTDENPSELPRKRYIPLEERDPDFSAAIKYRRAARQQRLQRQARDASLKNPSKFLVRWPRLRSLLARLCCAVAKFGSRICSYALALQARLS